MEEQKAYVWCLVNLVWEQMILIASVVAEQDLFSESKNLYYFSHDDKMFSP